MHQWICLAIVIRVVIWAQSYKDSAKRPMNLPKKIHFFRQPFHLFDLLMHKNAQNVQKMLLFVTFIWLCA